MVQRLQALRRQHANAIPQIQPISTEPVLPNLG